MLLYVNKKQQKRKRIKLISLILFCVFVVFANILYFKKDLHNSDKNLIDYTSITVHHNWYYSSQNITLFSSKNKQSSNIILIPIIINRENIQIIAHTLSKLKNITSIEFTDEVPHQKLITSLAHPFWAKQPNKSNKKVLITTNIENIRQQIYNKKLFPTVINYQQAQKIKNNSYIMSIINKEFPLPIPPQNILEEQRQSLQKFAQTYYTELKQLPQIPNYKNLSAHGFFLQNINLCIQTNNTKICAINNNNSFQKNIDIVLKQLPNDNTIIRLSLLTSLEEINQNTILEANDGLLFKYGIKEKILLPSEVIDIKQKQQNPYTEIKKQAGLNYYYESDDMKFYKFKIVEIDINDKI